MSYQNINRVSGLEIVRLSGCETLVSTNTYEVVRSPPSSNEDSSSMEEPDGANMIPPPVPDNRPRDLFRDGFNESLRRHVKNVPHKILINVLKLIRKGYITKSSIIELPFNCSICRITNETLSISVCDLLAIVPPAYQSWVERRLSTNQLRRKLGIPSKYSLRRLIGERHSHRPLENTNRSGRQNRYGELRREHEDGIDPKDSVSQIGDDDHGDCEEPFVIPKNKWRKSSRKKWVLSIAVIAAMIVMVSILGALYTFIHLTSKHIPMTVHDSPEIIDGRGMMLRLFYNLQDNVFYLTRQSISDRQYLSYEKFSMKLHAIGEKVPMQIDTQELCAQVSANVTCCDTFCRNINLDYRYSIASTHQKQLQLFGNGTNMLARLNSTYSEIRSMNNADEIQPLYGSSKITGKNPLAVFLNTSSNQNARSLFLVNETQGYELCTTSSQKIDNNRVHNLDKDCLTLPDLRLSADYAQRISVIPITQYIFAIAQSWADDRQLRYMARIYDRRAHQTAKLLAKIDGDPISAFYTATDVVFAGVAQQALQVCYVKMDVSSTSRIRCERYDLSKVIKAQFS